MERSVDLFRSTFTIQIKSDFKGKYAQRTRCNFKSSLENVATLSLFHFLGCLRCNINQDKEKLIEYNDFGTNDRTKKIVIMIQVRKDLLISDGKSKLFTN